MFKTNNEQSTNLRQSGNSAASQNYEQRSSINIRAPGFLGGEGPGIMETAVYATCILSVLAAIMQFMGQPTPDPFSGADSSVQPVPVVSHHLEVVVDTKS